MASGEDRRRRPLRMSVNKKMGRPRRRKKSPRRGARRRLGLVTETPMTPELNKNILFVFDHDLCAAPISTDQEREWPEAFHAEKCKEVARTCKFSHEEYFETWRDFVTTRILDRGHDFIVLSQNNETNIRRGWKVAGAPIDRAKAVLSVHDINQIREVSGIPSFGKYEAKPFLLKEFMVSHGYHFAVFVDDNKKERKAMRASDLHADVFDVHDERPQVKTFDCPRPKLGEPGLAGFFNYPSHVLEMSEFVEQHCEKQQQEQHH